MILPPMNHAHPRSARGLLAGLLGLASACGQKQAEQKPDHPRLLPAIANSRPCLHQHHCRYEFDTMRGGHDWKHWNLWLQALFARLVQHLSAKN